VFEHFPASFCRRLKQFSLEIVGINSHHNCDLTNGHNSGLHRVVIEFNIRKETMLECIINNLGVNISVEQQY